MLVCLCLQLTNPGGWGPSYQLQAQIPQCQTLSFQSSYSVNGGTPLVLLNTTENLNSPNPAGFCQVGTSVIRAMLCLNHLCQPPCCSFTLQMTLLCCHHSLHHRTHSLCGLLTVILPSATASSPWSLTLWLSSPGTGAHWPCY